jgi:hypothetical protein
MFPPTKGGSMSAENKLSLMQQLGAAPMAAKAAA